MFVLGVAYFLCYMLIYFPMLFHPGDPVNTGESQRDICAPEGYCSGALAGPPQKSPEFPTGLALRILAQTVM